MMSNDHMRSSGRMHGKANKTVFNLNPPSILPFCVARALHRFFVLFHFSRIKKKIGAFFVVREGNGQFLKDLTASISEIRVHCFLLYDDDQQIANTTLREINGIANCSSFCSQLARCIFVSDLYQSGNLYLL